LRAICDLFELRRRQRGEREDWAVDTWAAVGAEVAAALRISLAKAGSYMNSAVAMLRLPAVAAVFAAGDIDMGVFQTIVYRTEWITDAGAQAKVDAELAARVGRWPSMTRGRLATEIDRVVVRHDRDAVRRARERVVERRVSLWDQGNGTTEVSGLLVSTDAAALDSRLDALARTVCQDDPRTVDQRRADALGALAVGLERLACRCGLAPCPAGPRPSNPAVVIHIVAEQATVEGRSPSPGYLMGANTLISPEMVAELARTANQRPLLDFTTSGAEAGYRPSRALAAFVRARDLTCRAPGCDKPATVCDIDHTIPWPAGPTHAGNLKCLCRQWNRLAKEGFGSSRAHVSPSGRTSTSAPASGDNPDSHRSAAVAEAVAAPADPFRPRCSEQHFPGQSRRCNTCGRRCCPISRGS
jgi:hypothetical protein